MIGASFLLKTNLGICLGALVARVDIIKLPIHSVVAKNPRLPALPAISFLAIDLRRTQLYRHLTMS